MAIAAPVNELGYAQTPASGYWWLYEDEQTPELIWPLSVYVYDRMRREDAQVASVLRAVTQPLRRTPWRVDPAGARKQVVEFVAGDLGLPVVGQDPKPVPRLKDRFSWPDHLREALLMLVFGHMFFEQVYRISEDGREAHLRKLGPRLPKTLNRVDVAPDGGLVSITQKWTYDQALSARPEQPPPIPVDRLVAYVNEREGGNWLGHSLLRPAYKHWLIKDRLLRVQAQTIERNGMGIPLYTGAEEESDLSAGLKMATAWRAGEASGSAIPNGANLTLVGVQGQLPDAEPAIRYHDEQIARAVLAHFLNLGQHAGSGSWALGSTFADFFTLSLQTLAQQIAETATQHIVEDLVDLNFGEDEPAPKLVFDEIGSRQAPTAEAMKMLVDSGILRPDEVLEGAARQYYGLPPADPKTTRQPPQQTGPTPTMPTETGDMSVAASAADREVALEGDEDEEWQEAIDALTTALDELSGGHLEAAWDPAKHARNPKGSPGGGRFRSMVDRLKDAITEHERGNGAGHPFDGFDREQLRRVAKARGIELKRGESRDSIAEKLLAHVRGGEPHPHMTAVVKKIDDGVPSASVIAALHYPGVNAKEYAKLSPADQKKIANFLADHHDEYGPDVVGKVSKYLGIKAPQPHKAPKAPKAPAVARVAGQDVSENRDILRAAVDDAEAHPFEIGRHQGHADPMMAGLAQHIGFDGLPEHASAERIQQEIDRGGLDTWRGVEPVERYGETVISPDQMRRDYQSGTAWYGRGGGANGIYTTTGRASAERYAGGKGAVWRVVLRADAKTIGHLDLAKMHREWMGSSRRAEGRREDKVLDDPGRFAMAHGYDAIVAPLRNPDGTPKGESYVVILNRTATLVEAP